MSSCLRERERWGIGAREPRAENKSSEIKAWFRFKVGTTAKEDLEEATQGAGWLKE